MGLSCRKIRNLVDGFDDVNIDIQVPIQGTPLHYVCSGGDRYADIVRWMVQEQFADINSTYNGNLQTPKDSIVRGSKSYNFLQDMEGRFADLRARVQTFRGCLRQGRDIGDQLEEIKQLMASKDTPGCAKQVVMSNLVDLHTNYERSISEDDLKELYSHVLFNGVFLHAKRFESAVRFAIKNDIRDIEGKTILVASALCGIHNRYHTDLFEENGAFYSSGELFETWLETRPHPESWRIANLFRRRPSVQEGITKGFIDTLDAAKEHDKKKQFRDLANRAKVMDYLQEKGLSVKIRARELRDADAQEAEIREARDVRGVHLAPEIAAKVLSYTDGDFGNKLYFE